MSKVILTEVDLEEHIKQIDEKWYEDLDQDTKYIEEQLENQEDLDDYLKGG